VGNGTQGGKKMKIIRSSGFECEKKLPTTLEDLFNQSNVVYAYNGKEKMLNVTYLRYFDQYLKEQNIYNEEDTGVPFYEISALLILMNYHGLVEATRLYFNNTNEFLHSFKQEDIKEALSIYKSL
jgi:hypothetical protein